MSFSRELAALFDRDLTRLLQELEAFPDQDTLWRVVPGISNCAGNLALHLEGNLREYIGRRLGGADYTRHRAEEFSRKDVPASDLVRRIREVKALVPPVVAHLTEDQLEVTYPDPSLGRPVSTSQFVLSIYGHFHYHLGQIDYLRRVLTASGAIPLAQL